MPRPVKSRRICGMPEYCCFAPQESCSETVLLTLDEYETIRLIDYTGQSQEQCAAQMEVARTTVTAIYDSARRKIADCIVNGKRLEIAGGNFRIAENAAAESIPITDQYAVTSLSRSRSLFSISLTSFWKNGMKKRRNHEGAIHDVRRSFT